MAYVHCHNCDWSQDDFWSFKGYNPIRFFWKNVLWGRSGYWKPRRIEYDSSVIKEYGWKRTDPHSWWLLARAIRRIFKDFLHQKWWTYASWKKTVEKNGNKWPVCPKCGKPELDID